jgi:hypothetical protein
MQLGQIKQWITILQIFNLHRSGKEATAMVAILYHDTPICEAIDPHGALRRILKPIYLFRHDIFLRNGSGKLVYMSQPRVCHRRTRASCGCARSPAASPTGPLLWSYRTAHPQCCGVARSRGQHERIVFLCGALLGRRETSGYLLPRD